MAFKELFAPPSTYLLIPFFQRCLEVVLSALWEEASSQAKKAANNPTAEVNVVAGE